ncbi:MAG: YwmB family TATA-box binding protein [Firmicutes bacterium]|nr:YwmB family TATA-box binding protein [Bacillota bacterium]
MKRWLWILVAAGLLWTGQSVDAAVTAPLQTAFHATTARPTGFALSGWVQMKDNVSAAQLPTLLTALAQKAHVQGALQKHHALHFTQWVIQQNISGFHTTLMAEKLGSGHAFLVFSRTGQQQFSGLKESVQVMQKMLASYGTVHFDTTLTGSLRGSQSPKDVAQAALTALGATVQFTQKRSHFELVSALSPLISTQDLFNGHKINVQIVVMPGPKGSQIVDIGSPLMIATATPAD